METGALVLARSRHAAPPQRRHDEQRHRARRAAIVIITGAIEKIGKNAEAAA